MNARQEKQKADEIIQAHRNCITPVCQANQCPMCHLTVRIQFLEDSVERLTKVVHELDPIWAEADAAYERSTGD